MTDNIEGDRVYLLRQPAWHGKGYVSQEEMGAMDALIAIGGGHYFEQRPVKVLLNGQEQETGDLAIIRSAVPDDPTERIFGFTTERYKLFQPLDAASLFDLKLGKPVETLGFLGHGERMFLTWSMENFEVVQADPINLYGFVALGFDSLLGCSLNITSVRVVCQNTWMSALQEAESNNFKEKGKGQVWSGKHTSKNMQRDLGEWLGYVNQEAERQTSLVKDFFGKLVQFPITESKEALHLLNLAYPDPAPVPDYYPDTLRVEKQKSIDIKTEQVFEIREGILDLFDGDGTKISSDFYGLFNATTEYFNYVQKSKKDTINSRLFGNRANNMNAMAKVLQFQMAEK
jgi:hypothetical protein